MEATRPGVQALAEVFACGMLTGVLKGASTPWSAATASSVHFPARLPFPGQHGPSGLRERRPTDTAATSPGSPCAWRPSSSDGSSQTRSGVQAAAWLWAQPGSGAGPAPGGVDTAPSRPTLLTGHSTEPPHTPDRAERASTPLPGPCGRPPCTPVAGPCQGLRCTGRGLVASFPGDQRCEWAEHEVQRGRPGPGSVWVTAVRSPPSPRGPLSHPSPRGLEASSAVC